MYLKGYVYFYLNSSLHIVKMISYSWNLRIKWFYTRLNANYNFGPDFSQDQPLNKMISGHNIIISSENFITLHSERFVH